MNSIENRIRRLEKELALQKEKQRKILEQECSTIAERITREAAIKNITQTKLAKAAGVTRQSISYWTNGRTIPNAEQLGKIAKLLNVTCDYLIYGKEDK